MVLLKKAALFQGVAEEDIGLLLKCLGVSFRSYAKGETVYHAGDDVREIGLVVRGRVHVIGSDAWGNNNLLAELADGEMFAEAFVCGGVRPLPVSVVAVADAEVMFFDFQRVVATCPSACVFHTLVIRNMIAVFARKNIAFAGKMEHLTKRTTKAKLLSYLSEQARLCGSDRFEIPFDRQGLADYLSVDRSALSAVMSELKAGGAIDYRKNRFELLREPE
jgi:CRP-like cAMP-binding protein